MAPTSSTGSTSDKGICDAQDHVACRTNPKSVCDISGSKIKALKGSTELNELGVREDETAEAKTVSVYMAVRDMPLA